MNDTKAMSRDGWTYTLKKIPCGKKCSACPHGPYVYRTKRIDGKCKTEYLGQFVALPGTTEATFLTHLEFFHPKNRSIQLAKKILGIRSKQSLPQWHEAYQKAMATVRNSRKATEANKRLVMLAWDYLKANVCGVVPARKKPKPMAKDQPAIGPAVVVSLF